MKIAYVANARMPTEKAHGLQIVQMCKAFAQRGHEVTLVVPKRRNPIRQDLWSYYGLEPTFRLVEIPVFDLVPLDRWIGRWGHALTTLFFTARAGDAVAELAPDAVYTRELSFAAFAPKGVPLVFEAHDFPARPGPLERRSWRRCARIVSVTAGLTEAHARAGVPREKLLTAHDGVEPPLFRVRESKEEARRALGLPEDAFVAAYTGHLYAYKGADDLAAASHRLPAGALALFVGGHSADIARVRAAADPAKAVFVGAVPHARVPLYLRAADVTVLPTRAADDHASKYLSPLKLFEYLAAGKATVVTDLPSVREVLGRDDAIFIPPGDPSALAEALSGLMRDPGRRVGLERAASGLAGRHTWRARAAEVLRDLPPRSERIPWTERYRAELRIAAVALALRLAFVLLFPHSDLGSSDALGYLAEADVMRGAREWTPGMMPFVKPGYPMFLAFIRAVFGESLHAVRIAQAVLSALTVFLTARLGRRAFGAAAGTVAGWLLALHVPAFFEMRAIYTETLYALAVTFSMFLLFRAEVSSSAWKWLQAGAAFAAAGVVRELSLYFGPVLAALALLPRPRFLLSEARRAAKWYAAFLVPIALTFAVFPIYNAKLAAERRVDSPPLIAESYEKTFADPQSWKMLLSPDRWTVALEGAAKYFAFPHRIWEMSGDDGTSTKALFLSGDLRGLARRAPEVAVKVVLVVLHWSILAFAAYGLLKGAASRRRRGLLAAAILLPCLAISAYGVVRIQGFSDHLLDPLNRHRFPVEPMLMILAGLGAEAWLRRKETGRLGRT
jgi:glycosyltransferase involved in cell wall biosynthesis